MYSAPNKLQNQKREARGRQALRVAALVAGMAACAGAAGCAKSRQMQVNGDTLGVTGASFWDRRKLRPFLEDVHVLAQQYAREKNCEMKTVKMPDIEIVRDSSQLEKLTGLPAKVQNMQLHGACDYGANRIYSLSADFEVLAHEMGHWYFSESEDVADDFMYYVLKNRPQVKKIAQNLNLPPAAARQQPGRANRPPVIE